MVVYIQTCLDQLFWELLGFLNSEEGLLFFDWLYGHGTCLAKYTDKFYNDSDLQGVTWYYPYAI